MSNAPISSEPVERTSTGNYVLLWLVVTGLVFAWSLWRVPIPGVNEPHYLTKAKHYWNPVWCTPASGTVPDAPDFSGDVFLDSANPHEFFYRTLGWLTVWLPLEQVAWWGRLFGNGTLALGWVSFCTAAVTERVWRWSDVLGPLALLLLLQASGTWSGEWLVGGIESKVPAYGLFFWGLGALLRGHWRTAAVGYGLSISFHPLVGLWGVIATGCALCYQRWCGQLCGPSRVVFTQSLLLCALTAAPGLWPALTMLAASDPAHSPFADYLMVAHRLKHHLDPGSFPLAHWQFFVFCLGTWFLLRQAMAVNQRRRQWELVVIATVFIAAVGVAVAMMRRPLEVAGWGAWQVRLLKFYPFRLPDLLVPLGLSFAICEYWQQHAPQWWQRWSVRRQELCSILCSLSMLYAATQIPGPDQNPSGLTSGTRQDWIACCHWLRDNTPPTASVYATNERWAIKWFAERSEYVNYKDCPQDARHISEWNRRQWVIAKWRKQAFQDWRVTSLELADLRQQTGITHLLCSRFGPVQIAPVFQQGEFTIYELP